MKDQRTLSFICYHSMIMLNLIIETCLSLIFSHLFTFRNWLVIEIIVILKLTVCSLLQVEGPWPTARCKRILFSEAEDGIQVHPVTRWALRSEPGDHEEINLLVTKYGRSLPGTTIMIVPFVCPKIFYEYGGPNIGTHPLPFPEQNLTTDRWGLVSNKFQAPNPGEPRKYIDGQLYPYVYWANSNPLDVKGICEGKNALTLLNSYIVIRVFNRFTYREPPTWNEDVYPVFKQYATLFPVMTQNYVDLGNYHEVMTHLSVINMTLRLPASHPNHMPVTRDLSRGKLNMILKWIDHPCPGSTEDFTVELLRQHLQTALEVEHSTIPAYLTALATIKDNYNVQVQAIFRQILIQEMLHLALVANILNAVGGKPMLFSKNFIPFYPSRMPGGLMPKLQIPIERCSIALIADIFMKIEEPSVTAEPDFGSLPSTIDVNKETLIPSTGTARHFQISELIENKGELSSVLLIKFLIAKTAERNTLLRALLFSTDFVLHSKYGHHWKRVTILAMLPFLVGPRFSQDDKRNSFKKASLQLLRVCCVYMIVLIFSYYLLIRSFLAGEN